MSPTSNLKAYLQELFPRFMGTKDQGTSPMATTEPNDAPKQHFRTDNDSSATFTLPDGRKLGYAQYGSPTGRPIFYMHGFPGSRLEAAGFDDLGKELGARIISVDRPGIGWSSPQPGRTLLDFPKDVEQLGNHLGLDRYSVFGISGGGPYALACAKGLPAEKLKCASIVVGMGPPDIGMSGAGFVHRMGFPYGLRWTPLSLARWFWRLEGSGRIDLTDEQRLEMILKRPVPNEKDRIFMQTDWPRLSLRVTREAFAQGYEGMWIEGKVICSDFGFRVEDIRPDLPVQLWYGKHDTFVPPNHGIQIAKRLGKSAELHLEDETHASIVINRSRDIWADLVKKT